MSLNFEELDYRPTRLGELSLRRRRFPHLDGRDVYEVKLGEEFLMSSLFTEAEVELARLGLRPLEDRPIHAVVGGLGLGYTAAAALEFANVQALLVIEALAPVIDWHRRGLLPLSAGLTGDPRCRLAEGDFFRMAAPDGGGFDPQEPDRRFDAILLDIDHSPDDLLHLSHDGFYRGAGLEGLIGRLTPGGVFALWSNDPPDRSFVRSLARLFAAVDTRVVRFDNPLQGCESANTIYIARRS